MRYALSTLTVLIGTSAFCQSYLDPSFSEDGIFIHQEFDVPGCSFQDLVLQPDGKPVALGCETILRLLPDGTYDAAFNQPVIGLIDGNLDQVGIDPQNRIVAVGSQMVDFDTRSVALRFLSNGDLDPQYGNSGIAMPAALANGRFLDLAFASDGGVFILGYREAFPDPISILVKLTVSGALDLTFNGSGYVDILPVPNSIATDFVRSPTGELYFTGGSSGGPYVAAYTSQGTLDTQFNGTGFRQFAGDFASPRIHISGDGALLMSYWKTDVWENNAFGLIKVLTNGQLAAGFGQAGIWEASFGVDYHFMPRTAISSGTGILLAGHFLRPIGPGGEHPFFVSLTSEGTLNEAIGNNGMVSDTLNFCNGGSLEAVVDPLDRIFFWGASVTGFNEATVLAYLDHQVGVEEIGYEPGIALTPNPSKSTVRIRHSLSGAFSVRITDSQGRCALELPAKQRNSDFGIDVHKLNAGFYWITLSDSRSSTTAKLLIE